MHSERERLNGSHPWRLYLRGSMKEFLNLGDNIAQQLSLGTPKSGFPSWLCHLIIMSSQASYVMLL